MSNAGPPIVTALREVWFWSGVFRDHGQFIHDNLAPDQPNYIRWAQGFHHAFEQIHTEVKQLSEAASLPGPAGSYATAVPPAEPPLADLEGQELIRYEHQAQRMSNGLLQALGSLKSFKEELLAQKLDCKVKLGLGPGLLSHMIIEAEEGQRALDPARGLEQLPPPLQALHHHLVWLPDAAGHASALHGGLDGSERELLNTTAEFRQIFSGMQIQALELYGMLRVAPRMVGALRRLNRDAMTQIRTFRVFLAEMREHLEGCEVLGTLVPLFADHMLREELYYTEKMMALDGAR